MRAFNSPVANSYMADRSDDEAVEVLGESVRDRVDTWLGWVRDAKPVPAEERAALRERDHLVRTYGYTLDPMNELSKKFLGAERVEELVATRAGLGQIAAWRPGGGAAVKVLVIGAGFVGTAGRPTGSRELGHDVTVTTTTPGQGRRTCETLRGRASCCAAATARPWPPR